MNGIKQINLNNVYAYTHNISAPSFKGAEYSPVQNQTQMCSPEANKAITSQMRILTEMNAKEHFLNKRISLPDIERNLNVLYDLSEYINNSPALKSLGYDYEALCELYFEGIKFGNNSKIDLQKQKENLKKLIDFGSNPDSAKLYEKISKQVFNDIVLSQADIIGNFDKKTLECYNRLFNEEVYEPYLKKIRSAKIVSSILQGEDTQVINKNLDELKKITARPEFSFLREISPDFDIIKYKGDTNKFFNLLKTFQDKLQDNEKLNFIIDSETNEAVITVKDEVNKNFVLKEAHVFDINLNKISSDLTMIKGEEGNKFVQYIKGKDYKNTINYELRRVCDDSKEKKEWILDKLVKEYRDDKGNILKREIIKQSGIDGVFNIKILDADGKIHTTAKAFKNPDGSIYIEKNLKNPDGFTTRIRYKNRIAKGVQDAEIMDYTVFDSNGKQIAKRENILQKINEFANFSLKDGEKHKIYFDRNNINVVNEKTGKVKFIKLDELIREGDEELKKLFKTLSGSTLESISDSAASVVRTFDSMESYCIPETKYLEVEPNRFVFHHEAGHLKSYSQGSIAKIKDADISYTALNGNKGRLSTDSELVKIFNEEKNRFVSSVPRRIRSFAKYYNDSSHLKAYSGLDEVFADIEALLNDVKVPKSVMDRVHLLAENYPRTIMYIMKRKF